MSELGEFRIDDQLLSQSDALLAAIVRSATDAIIALDSLGTVISWNRGAQIHFGYPEREMIGLPVSRFIPPDRTREQESALARVFAGELVGSFQTVRTTRTGKDVTVSVAMSPIYDASGSVIAASAIVRPRQNVRRRAGSTGQADMWSALEANRAEDAGEATEPNPNILVVEDEALVGLGLASMLENAGFDVIGPVGDLDTAMAMLDVHECALAILDINLAHGETSAPLAERLKRSGIPFLVTSGNQAALGKGIFRTGRSLPKPVGARALVAAVQEALA
ncbi:MAG TPA: PAS domain S-box protein [Sphingobium sp.]